MVTQPSAGQLLIWTDNASKGMEGRVKGVDEDKEDSEDKEDKELR